ncbi:MAG TPA: ATP-binding protein, partial [Mariniphaga sp.]|nr:ATP-binding protein [Mariniphaga sp.]
SILSNLIKNAIKFTSEGTIHIGNYSEDEFLVFYVKDTGRGIPQDKLNSVFERFMQVDTSLTRAHEGSGLGLAIAKAYVDLLGGSIWVESEVGKGSTFYFSIPYKMNTSHINILKNIKPVPESFKKTIVLIAEDDDASYQYLDILLRKKNIKSLRAYNGKQALEKFISNPDISLILMDIKMPVMDGIEATKEIRKLNVSIPIIAQTSYTFSRDELKAKEAGCNAYLTKPILPEELFRMLKTYLK